MDEEPRNWSLVAGMGCGTVMVILTVAALFWLLSWVGGWVGLLRWPVLVIGTLFLWRMLIQTYKLLRREWG